MLKPVTVIMVVLVTLVFLLMVTVKPYYYFILDLGVTAIPNLMVLILSLHNHGQKPSMKVMVLFCYSLQIRQMKNKESRYPMTTATNIPKWTASGDWLMFVDATYRVLASLHKLQLLTNAMVY